ncbi:MAG: aminotransferase class V-fold PLP-dependent enzyme [Gemmatimonadetes bacterium]|nr:aminotransferase class V-fold PLP-dependent enzyme [Gemmatimonadota bacterium]MBT8404585.1 aminotransferase class V-fold PLP-dependent enzyme [Gemmatimonadota bacterium]NNF38225.1 aminotransferase class V-fold PLP-dependent enzyme [Gemmatimonadota bacterium]NNK64254.1 aminotransferase class V-fold PLP-dependent enzyme [Gemmatimonadota bacterium]
MTLNDDELHRLRARFPILGRRNYLNSCSLGALSVDAEAELDDFKDHWHRMGASAWYEHWMGKLDTLRAEAAGLHGAQPSEAALLPSTSAALAVVADAVPQGERNRVVCTELDFPTLAYQWRVKPEIELVVLRSPDGIRIDPKQFEEVVDERTLFVATSHVFFSTGYVQDITALARIAREAGAWSLIDGYQAPGQIPVDMTGAGVDMYTSGPLKWLCGGPGLSYLFVRQDRIAELHPRFTSWFAAKDQFAFDFEHFEFRDDARRFELGTPSLPTVHLALGGQRALASVGWDRVFARVRELTDHLMGRCDEAGLTLRTSRDPARRSGIVMVAHPDPKGAVAHLDAMDIVVDHRPGHVRISPHVYNTVDEVDRVVDALLGTL